MNLAFLTSFYFQGLTTDWFCYIVKQYTTSLFNCEFNNLSIFQDNYFCTFTFLFKRRDPVRLIFTVGTSPKIWLDTLVKNLKCTCCSPFCPEMPKISTWSMNFPLVPYWSQLFCLLVKIIQE
jgi:hypothetical protein